MIDASLIERFKSVREGPVPPYVRFYGMEFIFRKIFSLPKWVPLNAHLEHGIIIDQTKPDQYLAKTNAEIVFVDTELRRRLVPHKSNVHVLGPLYMRYRRKLGFRYNSSAKGTIAYPTHSSHHLNVQMDWDGYAKSLTELPFKYQPVTVCLYWIDILKNRHLHFERLGLDVISNGDMFDENYAFNFYSNLIKFKYATGNEPGSFLFYAVELGMPFFIHGPEAQLVNDGFDMTALPQFTFRDIEYAANLKDAFSVEPDEGGGLTKAQFDLVKRYLYDKSWINDSTVRFLIWTLFFKTTMRKALKAIYRRAKQLVKSSSAPSTDSLVAEYIAKGQIPWSPGYEIHKRSEIKKAISAESLQYFQNNLIKPSKYGFRLDERIVEYPWILSRLKSGSAKVLDAGSTFNHDFIVNHTLVKRKDLHVFTYHPEKVAYWKQRISYVYGDLRQLPYRDAWFDEVVCQSTLEHIDMDNSIYGYSNANDKAVTEKSYSYISVVDELCRVLNPGGRLLITIPYGVFENHGFFQQFDSEMIERVLERIRRISRNIEVTFFKYVADGWTISSMTECNNARSFSPHSKKGDLGDGAAHSRSICCICADRDMTT